MEIRADLKAKTAEAALQKATAEMYAKEFNDYIKLNKEITDAIKDIKVHSNNYITRVESSPPPAVADGGTFELVPAGVPGGMPDNTAMSGMPGYENSTAGGTTADSPTGTGDPAGR